MRRSEPAWRSSLRGQDDRTHVSRTREISSSRESTTWLLLTRRVERVYCLYFPLRRRKLTKTDKRRQTRKHDGIAWIKIQQILNRQRLPQNDTKICWRYSKHQRENGIFETFLKRLELKLIFKIAKQSTVRRTCVTACSVIFVLVCLDEHFLNPFMRKIKT